MLEKRGKIVTFGEIMLRLTPPGYLRFRQTDRYEASYAGAEANAAIDLAFFGEDCEYVTALPENDLACGAVDFLRKYGVGVGHIVRRGERMGAYFLEKGASQRAGKVVYDRKNSAIALSKVGSFDWETIFRGADAFFTTGITAALGGEMPAVTLEAVRAAKNAGLRVAFDVNYRATLWTKAEARDALEKILPHVDCLITNVYQAADVFDIHGDEEAVSREFVRRYGVGEVFTTARDSVSASDNVLSAAAYRDGKFYRAGEYRVHIVDRVGGGDAFAAGVIHGERAGFDTEKTLAFALAASAWKHSVEGDANLASEEEILRVMADASGRIVR